MCRVAVEEGIAPEDALVMATLHPALAHGLDELGAIAPGYRADLVLLDDLTSFRAPLVVAGGRVAARDGRAEPFAAPAIPAYVLPDRAQRAGRRRPTSRSTRTAPRACA